MRQRKVDGLWRTVSKRFCKINSEWRQVARSYRKVDGLWRLVSSDLAVSKIAENTAYLNGTFQAGWTENGNPFASFDGTPTDPYNPFRVGVRIHNIPSGQQYFNATLNFTTNSPGMVYILFRNQSGDVLSIQDPYSDRVTLWNDGSDFIEVLMIAQYGVGRVCGSFELSDMSATSIY
jgi:hypothetical protein